MIAFGITPEGYATVLPINRRLFHTKHSLIFAQFFYFVHNGPEVVQADRVGDGVI